MTQMFRLALTIITLLIFTTLPDLALAQPDPGLLEKAVLAPFRHSFVGTMLNTTWSDGRPESWVIKTFHRWPDRNRWEYLDAQGNPVFIIINNAGKQWEISLLDRTVYISDGVGCCLPEEVPAELTRLFHNYQAAYNGSALIAGRETAIFALRPLYASNPTTVLWIDVETGIVLRLERYSPDGDLLEMRAYSSFELVEDLDPSLFVYSPSIRDKVVRIEHPELPEQVVLLQKQLGQTIRYPTNLPPGYRFTKGRVLSRFRPADTVQLQFADGLNSISVFQTFYPDNWSIRPGSPAQATKLLMEETEAFLIRTTDGYVLTWHKGNVTYSIVGNLAVQDLMRLAHSFRY